MQQISAASTSFSGKSFHTLCDQLGRKDKSLQQVLSEYGYPPMWTRPNTFETLVHIILEQQVSLASALAALNKLKDKLAGFTPAAMLQLSDAELRACYVSRQKTVYLRSLATALVEKNLRLNKIAQQTNDEIRGQLTRIKGIGHWTVDVYLMFVLQRPDIFPAGDLAAMNALKKIKQQRPGVSKEKLVSLTVAWTPYRTIGTMILWHYYLSSRQNVKPAEAKKINNAVSG